MYVHTHMWQLVFVEFHDALAGLWVIFGLDSAAVVLSGYVLFSFVHLFRHLTCPELHMHALVYTQEARGQ